MRSPVLDSEPSPDSRLIVHMVATLVVLGIGVCLFAVAFALLVRSALVLLLVRPLSDVPAAIATPVATEVPRWITVGVPVVSTGLVFGGLVVLHRWQRGLVDRQFDALTRDPPAALSRRLARLSQLADVPTPTLRLVDAAAPTAFTTGLRLERTQITVTTGLLATLGEDELEAVLAHELSHVKNRDVMVMNAVMTPIVIAAGLWTVTTTDSDRPVDGPVPRANGTDPFLFEGVVSGVFGAVAGAFWLFAWLATASFARYREFAADRGAAAITGDPAAVAGALETISKPSAPLPDLRLIGLNAFSIRPLADADHYWGVAWRTPADVLPDRVRARLSTRLRLHPETDRRLERLRTLENRRP